MAALQFYNPILADQLAYYASLMSWTFYFDRDRGIPLKIPADELMHRNLLHLYGIVRDEFRKDRFEDLWKTIEELIARDRIIVTWVDANYIDDRAFHYNRVPGEVELMMIYGYDHSDNTLDIIVNPQRFLGQVPLSSLPNILMDILAYDYCVPEGLTVWPESQCKQLLLADILAMQCGRVIESVETGFSAIESFIEEIKRRESASSATLYSWMSETFNQLAFTGPQRVTLGLTLKQVADLHRDEKIAAIGQRYIVIGQSWDVARNMFFKGCNRQPAAMLPRIRKRVEALLIEEQKLAQFLGCWL